MKLKFYGTAAAEGIPAPFCTCKVCEHARAFGGKNIRTRHLSTIDDDIQMDIGPDFFWHTVHNGLDAMKIRHLILTHSHGDHMDKLWINNRAHPYSLTGAQRINLVAGKKVLDVLETSLEKSFEQIAADPVIAVPFERIALDENTFVTAMPARHHRSQNDAMIYLIERGGKKLLYAHDTGLFHQEATDFLAGKDIDAATLDCTGTYLGAGSEHMDFSGCEEMVKRLKENGALKSDAKIIVNHYSHGGGANHDEIDMEAKKRGWYASYDTFEIEI